MSKKDEKPGARKLKFEKKKIRSLADSDLKDANGGLPTNSNVVAGSHGPIQSCQTGFRCCAANHNQGLRLR